LPEFSAEYSHGKEWLRYDIPGYKKESKMKSMHIWLAMILAVTILGGSSCNKNGDNGNGDDSDLPSFVQEACSGCVRDEPISSGGKVTGYHFYSYVKNNGGSGKIGMTIGVGTSTASKEFTVTANTSYTFRATVTVQEKSTSSFTYQAKFPGPAGYTDSHPINGYDFTGGPSDLQLNPR
jgi:hypothetical protein